jgi:hypothetical protein
MSVKQLRRGDDDIGEAAIGDMPNRYTSNVVLNQQARVAHKWWYGGYPYRAAQLLESPWQFGGRRMIRITPAILEFCPDLSQRVNQIDNLPITR